MSAQVCAPSTPSGWHPVAAGTPGAVPGCPPLVDTFAGPAGFGPNVLPANDDGSTAPFDLTAAFPGGLRFFGGPYTTVVVNNNGNITFGGSLYTYTPTPFPLTAGPFGGAFPMIAPYWADVDTRTPVVSGPAPAAGHDLVYWYISPGQLVVTWFDVGYYSSEYNHRMNFQMLLTNALDCGSGNFDVEFRYNQCEWTTGRASSGTDGHGGTPAQVGFDALNGVDYVAIPESLTAAVENVCTLTNVGMPGVYRFSVRGGAVACPGTGTPCEVAGGVGACSVGVTQCVGRDIVCTPIGASSPERCDGVDNDCNGGVDDGMDLCPSPLVCVAGACVPHCFEGGCASDQTCVDSGACVETACLTVTCPPGERCSGGACVGACEGIVCPHGQQCIAGHCANLCDILTCGTDEICVDGSCVPTCPCRACGTDEICGADGSCTPIGCDIVLCDPGFYCAAGACLDACDGAVCPFGQHCETGVCVETPMADAGVPDFPDGGVIGYDAGESSGGDAGSADAGRRSGARASSAGCGCSVPVERSTPGWALGLALFALVAWRRRRR